MIRTREETETALRERILEAISSKRRGVDLSAKDDLKKWLTESQSQLIDNRLLAGNAETSFGLRGVDISDLIDSPKGSIKPVYLNIRNPLDMDATWSKDTTKALYEACGISSRYDAVWGKDAGVSMTGSRVYGDIVEYLDDQRSVRKAIEDLGYDGITHIGGRELGDKGHRVWIAFEPEQIKSIDNSGEFNPSDANIYKSFTSQLMKDYNSSYREWREDAHPRDDRVRFARKGDIARAATDESFHQEMLQRFTDPEQRKMLEGAIEKIRAAGGDPKAAAAAAKGGDGASAGKQQASQRKPTHSESRPKLHAALQTKEKDLHAIKDKERAAVLDDEGNVLFETDGDASTVKFDGDTIKKMRGATLTHNHPDGWAHDISNPRSKGRSFSTPDLAMLFKAELKEMRAVTRGHRHSISIPEGFVDQNYENALGQFSDETKSDFSRMVQEGKLSKGEVVWYGHVQPALAKSVETVNGKIRKQFSEKKGTQEDVDRITNDHHHEIVSTLASELGLNYSREDIPQDMQKSMHGKGKWLPRTRSFRI